MKKHIKRLVTTATVSLALVGAGGITALASGYITWNGTNDFNSLIENLQNIRGRTNDLKNANSQQAENITDLQKQVADKDKEITELQEKVNGGKTTQGQLQQAEKDMKHANEVSEDLLKSMED